VDGSSVPVFCRGIIDHINTQSDQFPNQFLNCGASKYKFTTTQNPDGSMQTKSDPLNAEMWANTHIPPKLYTWHTI